jgi:hypothetical protein
MCSWWCNEYLSVVLLYYGRFPRHLQIAIMYLSFWTFQWYHSYHVFSGVGSVAWGIGHKVCIILQKWWWTYKEVSNGQFKYKCPKRLRSCEFMGQKDQLEITIHSVENFPALEILIIYRPNMGACSSYYWTSYGSRNKKSNRYPS